MSFSFINPKVLAPADILALNLTASTDTEYDYTGLTTYSLGDIRKVSYEDDGTTPVVPVKTFKALGSVSSYPPDNSDPDDSEREWDDLGAVNQHRWADNYIDTSAYADGAEATDAGKIVITLNSSRQDKISLWKVAGTKVTFSLRDSASDLIDETEYDLETPVEDLEEYFYKGFQTSFDLTHAFPCLLVSTLTVTIEHEETGLYPGLGFLNCGVNQHVGMVINEPMAGFVDYMTAEDFKVGGVKNTYPDQESISVDVRGQIADINKVQDAVAAARNQATLWSGIDSIYGPFNVLGVLQGYDMVWKNDRKFEANFKIEGIQ